MTSLTQQALQQCPNTKIILSGYSQGGFVVHAAGKSLGATPPVGGEMLLLSHAQLFAPITRSMR